MLITSKNWLEAHRIKLCAFKNWPSAGIYWQKVWWWWESHGTEVDVLRNIEAAQFYCGSFIHIIILNTSHTFQMIHVMKYGRKYIYMQAKTPRTVLEDVCTHAGIISSRRNICYHREVVPSIFLYCESWEIFPDAFGRCHSSVNWRDYSNNVATT